MPARVVPERYVEEYLGSAPSLVWLLVVNATAFLVGVRFYVETMPAVPTFLWPLYGDSPTALALATLSLATLLPNLGNRVRDAPVNLPLAYLHTFAFVWLVKYGIWTAIALNVHPGLYFGFDRAALYDYWFIILTHLLFVLQAFVIPYYGRTTKGALGAALVLLVANDVFDYGFGYHPPLRYEPGLFLPTVTVALTIVAVGLARWAFDPLSGADGGRS
ncbi:DUF1405 domain-containing protein [Haloferacaceae archaeon DSL9]